MSARADLRGATRCVVVLSSALSLELHSRGGDEQVVERLAPGHSFGEAFVFDASPSFPLTCVAREPATLVLVPYASYRAVIAGNASACVRLLADMNRRVHALVREVEAHSLTDARTRIVRHVLELAAAGAGPRAAAKEVVLPEPKQRIAARLGISPETFSRTLRTLREAGLLSVRGRTIEITDWERLRAVA